MGFCERLQLEHASRSRREHRTRARHLGWVAGPHEPSYRGGYAWLGGARSQDRSDDRRRTRTLRRGSHPDSASPPGFTVGGSSQGESGLRHRAFQSPEPPQPSKLHPSTSVGGVRAGSNVREEQDSGAELLGPDLSRSCATLAGKRRHRSGSPAGIGHFLSYGQEQLTPRRYGTHIDMTTTIPSELVVVCGGGGFIGGHLVGELLRQGRTVRSVDVKPP